jgi:hypothetical protein
MTLEKPWGSGGASTRPRHNFWNSAAGKKSDSLDYNVEGNAYENDMALVRRGERPDQAVDIKQIPSVEGIVWALHSKMPGEVWEPEKIAQC